MTLRVVLAAALLVALPRLAEAHGLLQRSVPARDARLAVAPRELRLTFNERVELAVAQLVLVGPDAREVPLGPLHHAGDSVRTLVADVLGPLVAGAYTVRWRTAGADGHPVNGEFGFVIERGAAGLAPPAAPVAGTPPAPAPLPAPSPTSAGDERFSAESPAYVLVRWVSLLALVVLAGAAAFALLVLPRAAITDTVRARAAARARGLALLAAALLLAAADGRLLAQALALQGGSIDAARTGAMLAGTTWGQAWLLQVTGVVVVLLALLLVARRSGWHMAAIGIVAAALGSALSGHAAAAGRVAPLAVGADALHALGAGGWLGTLLVLLVAGIPAARAEHDEGKALAALVRAFSPVALGCAAVVGASGLIAATLHLGGISELWTSAYGRTLLVKLLCLGVVLAAGALNWRRVRPALGQGPHAAARLRRSATVELVAGAAVLAVTAVLVALPPPAEEAAAVAVREAERR
ncbi:MAG TPA: CopD family protein [Gemmatimonadaceae bacterium]|nr:CopD family protein [Gemmatimonadaceae bacterium]